MTTSQFIRLALGASAFSVLLAGSLAMARDPSLDDAQQQQQQAQSEEQVPIAVKDYDVFVDLPTAFAFIKLPTGWKFIGKLDATQLSHLPAGTLTALLKPEDGPTRMAAKAPVLMAKAQAAPMK